MRRFVSVVAASVVIGMQSIALAAVFPDVQDGHIYQNPIEVLVGAGVINGNPDGNFYPDRPVNRAEMLKMLYIARGKYPDSSSVRCFKDVEPNSWYEMYVCDAASNRYIDGYPDGTFQPSKEVNRVEALKMIMEIFDLDIQDTSESTRDIVKFVDVSTSAWYTKYLYAAYEMQILPIAGQDGARFYPDWPLLRGEAAAYIYNALNAELQEQRSTTSQSKSSRSSSSTTNTTTNTQTSSSTQPTQIATSFPFDTSGKFSEKEPYSYTFSLSGNTSTYFEVSLTTAGTVSCRLYLLKESGFSERYYLGKEEGNKCFIRAALSPGNFQLQLQPSVADASFTVKAEEKAGDGNDGFREAVRLLPGVPKSAVLEVNDIADWYTFSVTSQTSMQLSVTNGLEIDCLVYAMSDVDLFGFTGPACNQNYAYPKGTYFVAISRKVSSKATKKTYTVQLQ